MLLKRHITSEILKVYFVNFLQLQMSLLCLFRRKKAKKGTIIVQLLKMSKKELNDKKRQGHVPYHVFKTIFTCVQGSEILSIV